jgi:hypothetical protein
MKYLNDILSIKLFIIIFILLINVILSCDNNHCDRIKNKSINTSIQNELNYVNDTITAIRIAEAIWLEIYGDEIYMNKPYNAILLEGKVWEVSGTLHTEKGGVPYIEIQKSDGKILKVYHTK